MLKNPLDLVTIEEKFQLKPYVFLKGGLSWPYLNQMSEASWIKRNLVDDTFDVDIYLHDIPMVKHGEGSSFINVNNAFQISQGFKTTFPRPVSRHTYHRSQFKNQKLRSSKMIAFGLRRTYVSQSIPIDYITYILTPHFYYPVNQKTLYPNQALHLKLPKKIAFTIPWEDGHGSKRFNFQTDKLRRIVPISQVQYNHMVVVPEKLILGKTPKF
ncbi:hypothetical protein [Mycoplasma sp. ATU-Cv-508]|uniref:hypothetical protein n=1 Tax=Mycoplasma sp. ATU-Cv-508 TaxID=2048001 RepID=UPI000FDF1BF1